jgi:ATP-dependent Clp endopeptidase proteolytic subunit ClpP
MSTDYKAALLAAEVALLEAEARDLEARVAAATAKDVRYLPLIGAMDTQLAAQALGVLATWRREDEFFGTKRPIYIGMNLMPGDPRALQTMVNPYIDTFALVDYLRLLVADGYDINAQVTGQAVQHGAVLLQTPGIKRIVTPHSHLMFTEESFSVQANSAEMREKLKFLKRLEEHGREIVIERTGDKITKERLSTETAYQRQWWIDSKTSVELGLADRIDVDLIPGLKPYSCDPELLPAEGDTLEIRKIKAQTRRNLAEAAALRLNAEQSEMDNAGGPIMFIGGIGPSSCTIAAAGLMAAHRRNPNGQADMYIYSPGGSVVDGAALLDVIDKVKGGGLSLSTTNLGCAGSMGGFLLQCASKGKRRAGKHSRILIHRMWRVFGGGSSQLKDQEEMTKALEDSVLPLLIGNSDLTMERYMEETENKDWWVESDEALKLRLVDEVI